MGAIFRNGEMKNFTISFVLISLAMLALMMGFLNANIQSINQASIKQNIGIIGAVAKEYPELEEKLVQNYIKGYHDNYLYGKEILKKYSYDEELKPYKNSILSKLYSDYFSYCIISVVLLILMLYMISLFYFNRVYKKIRQLQDAAQRIVEGSFSKTYNNYEEGDLYILAHQFNQMSDRLKETIEALKREKNRLKDFISDITHQLKTPLASLIMFNELMTNDMDMDKEERAKFLSISKNQLERIEWLTKSLLKMARFEAGVVTFNKVKAPVYNTILIALEGIYQIAKLKKVDIKIIGKEEIQIAHDIDWTAEALSNIIKNSIEHSSENGEIIISYEETMLALQISIEDKGEGIKETELPRIFERFYKGESSTNPMSIGIGLYIAKTIIEDQQGSIAVDSKENAGTKFTITFLKTVI